MSCFCCLNWCFPEEPVDNSKKEPLVDLEKVIRKCAMEQVKLVPPADLTWKEKLRPLQTVLTLEVDKSFLGFQPAKEMSLYPRNPPNGGDHDIPTSMESASTVLFQSRFRNDTSHVQIYSFKTERQTKSSLEISLQRGFSFGQTLELDVKLPTGLPDCEVSGKLGSQLQWTFQRGKITRQEDQVTWAVDNQVAVASHTTGEARLKVRECRWTADFVMPCKISPRTEDSVIPVFVRRKSTGDLLQIVELSCSDVVDECNYFKLADGNPGQMMCEMKGVCHVVCAVEQEVWLKEAKILPPQPELQY